MTKAAGVWIDHRRAVVAVVSDQVEDTKEIRSGVEKHRGRPGGVRSTTPYESQKVQADDRRQREFTGELNVYYDEVMAWLRGAKTILIFGPGEAKGELQRRFVKDGLGERIAAVETADKMTDRQIAARVRQYFEDGEPASTRASGGSSARSAKPAPSYGAAPRT